MTYAEKLKDPRWQRKKNGILERDKYTCQRCGAKDKTLHVHHKVYIYGNNPWDYNDILLETLCLDCHKSEHLSEQSIATLEDQPAVESVMDKLYADLEEKRRKENLRIAEVLISRASLRNTLNKIRKEISERNKPVNHG